MKYFSILNGATALIHANGVYQQVELYARGTSIYAKKGAGYIRLGIGGATSAAKVRWSEFDQGDDAKIIEKSGNAPMLESRSDMKVAAE